MRIFRFVFLSFPEVALGMGIAAKPGHVTLRVFFSTHSRLRWSQFVHGRPLAHLRALFSYPRTPFVESQSKTLILSLDLDKQGRDRGKQRYPCWGRDPGGDTLAHFCQGDPLCGTHRSRANVTLLFPEPSTGISVEFWVSQNDGGIVQTNCNDIKSQEASRVFFPFNVKRESSLNYERDTFFFPH